MKRLFSVFFIFLICCFPLCFCGSYLIEDEFVEIEIKTPQKSFVWNDSVYKKTSVFTYLFESQKNFRCGSHNQRADLIEKIMKMGFSVDDAFDYTFLGFKDLVNNICNTFNKSSKDANLIFYPNSFPHFVITQEELGFEVDKQKLYFDILFNLKKSSKVVVNLKIDTIYPNITKQELMQNAVLKSTFETDYSSSSENRKSNIQTAISKFNGLTLEPNEILSFNKITGKRTQENGYKEANIIKNNEYVEAFGGGVCQASTTLYNAVLFAGLEVLESHPHSLESGYVLKGFDAMVNFGSSDLKFKNNTNHKIFIRTYANDHKVGVQIFGEPNEYHIKRNIEVLDETSLPLIEVEDKSLYEEQSYFKTHPKTGSYVKSYLEYYKNGRLINKKLIRKQKYKAVQGVRVVGTKQKEIIEELPLGEQTFSNFRTLF